MWFPDYKYGFILNSRNGLFTRKGKKMCYFQMPTLRRW